VCAYRLYVDFHMHTEKDTHTRAGQKHAHESNYCPTNPISPTHAHAHPVPLAFAAFARSQLTAMDADSFMTSPSLPVVRTLPVPGITHASTNRTSPPLGVHASPVDTPGRRGLGMALQGLQIQHTHSTQSSPTLYTALPRLSRL
jgi:hypothetical protein